MDALINELSLNGQFASIDEFISSSGSVVNILEEIKKVNSFSQDDSTYISLYKKTDFNQAQITKQYKLYEILINLTEYRHNPQIQKLKSILAQLQNEPFWDEAPKHDISKSYLLDNNGNVMNVTGTSLAESIARNAVIISFTPSIFNISPITIKENKSLYYIVNIFQTLALIDHCHKNALLSHEDYILMRYIHKLRFDYISDRYGFDLITDQNIKDFLDAFRLFEEKDWQDIIVDNALDYKEFNKNRKTKQYFPDYYWSKGIYKFRISRRYRAFGYRENDFFYLLRFDLDHELSDNG